MVRLRSSAVAALLCAATFLGASPARAACDDPVRLPPPGSPLTAQALIELNEIGVPDGAVTDAPPPVTVDPTGKRIAFLVTRADLASNSYCHILMVMDLTGGPARVIARGGDFAPERAPMRGNLANWGTQLVTTPIWSPDSRWVAWLRRDKDRTQVWIAAADGSGARALTTSLTDVEDIRWEDRGRLRYATRPAAASVKAAIDREGQSGWLYDDRVTPNAGPRPLVGAASVPLEWFSVGLNGGRVRPEPDSRPSVAASVSGMLLKIDKASDLPGAGRRVTLTGPGGQPIPCRVDACGSRIVEAWWQPGSDTAWFLRREGWKRETSTIYRLRSNGGPERILATPDAVNFCRPASAGLVCLREGSAMPRTIILIDWTSGVPTIVYDPNPAFARFRLGKVTRLKWKNDRGLEAWGDLVLPPDYRPGAKLPLILTQYYSRGFLRGGVGNEYPVFLLAQRGFAVLSLERPEDMGAVDPTSKDAADVNRVNAANWADRWSVQSSIETGVKAAIATGAIDPKRIGISGLSDGGTSVRFALINSHLFAAAALSTCCVEPDTLAQAGPLFAKLYLGRGAPNYGSQDEAFWKPVALSLNADKIDTPLLMQLSDDEYQLALGAFEALRSRGKPVEMYIFPDEHHNKSQPHHRLAIYDRNIDWFDFWLNGREDPDPAKRDQYKRWEEMRAAR
jgi:dipeptidyl aminopeptidase/acylaminoacyl peptidase